MAQIWIGADRPPDFYAPARTVLQLKDLTRVYAFKWCHLSRKGNGRKVYFDPSSLSQERAQAMSQALNRLSKWFEFKNDRPQSVRSALGYLGLLLDWADNRQQSERFEAILSEPDLALEALKGYHTYLRSELQSHKIAPPTAGKRDQFAIACLSEIHDRVYRDHIEPLSTKGGSGTKAPESSDVAQFGSTLQTIFDSAAQLILHGDPGASIRVLRVSTYDEGKTVDLRQGYGPLRLMELACVAYTGLVFMDSGANQSVLTQYEEPEDLNEQLADPDRINLTEKAIKFRAGSKEVDVFLTATTVTRLKSYIQIRHTLVEALDVADIAPLFIQCEYATKAKGEPTGVRPLDRDFLKQLRNKIEAVGVTLPAVTLRQLRAYAQQRFVRTAPLPVAAKRMGHSLKTAVQAYCKAQKVTHQGEMAEYLGSLLRTVLDASEAQGKKVVEAIPAGACADYGNPSSGNHALAVEPDCSKVEGCFFCPNYRVHADEEDMRKLMSCRRVLSAIAPLQENSIRAEQVYSAVVDRIDALLEELRRRKPEVHQAVRVDVDERGQLTSYWARKLQQLHLLGMLPAGPFKPTQPLATCNSEPPKVA